MEWPMVAPAPVVHDHVGVSRVLVDHHGQWRHVQHYFTGMIILPNNSMTNIAPCISESADTSGLGCDRRPPIANVDASCASSW